MCLNSLIYLILLTYLGRPLPRRRSEDCFQRTASWSRAPAMELGDR